MNLFSWFKATKEVELDEAPELTFDQRIVYNDQVFEVGVTTALIIFEDGREVHTKFYGTVDQWVDDGMHVFRHTRKPMNVSEPYIATSVDVYKQFLNNPDPNQIMKIVDDPINPTVAWTGRVAHLEIFETLPYEVHHQVASIEESKDEVPDPSAAVATS